MKVTIDIDMDKDDYAAITKWLKAHCAEATIHNVLSDLCDKTLQRFKERADRYMADGKTVMERFMEEALL